MIDEDSPDLREKGNLLYLKRGALRMIIRRPSGGCFGSVFRLANAHSRANKGCRSFG
jgi:hypothetical protein